MPEYEEYPFSHRYTLLASDDSDYDLEGELVPTKRRWRVEHILCRYVDSNSDRIQVLIGRGTEEYLLCEHVDPDSETAYWWKEPVYLEEGDRLIARFFEVQEDADLYFYFRGAEIKRIR